MTSQKHRANLPVILIAGPTASGKSSVAITLAQRHNGVIINADSMQVYRELRIITARPAAEDEGLVPHHMYGFVPARERYSTGHWATDVRRVLDKAYHHGKIPIIVGGTGLYFRALTDGLAAIPDIPEEVSTHWRRQAEEKGAARLYSILQEKDAVMAARLKKGDTQRITRALEVLDATKKSLSYWQQQKGHPVLTEEESQHLVRLVIAPERPVLYGRIDKRFAQMVNGGGLDEVRHLLSLGLDPALPLMRALGVRELADLLEGRTDRDTAIERAQMQSRRYAKRQMTWLRRNMPQQVPENTTESNIISWKRFLSQERECLIREILSHLEMSGKF